MNLNHEDKEYYNKLWDYIYSVPFGTYPLKEMSEEIKIKFENTIKHWVSIDEFRVFNFYIEFTNEYDGIIKTEYPYNRMARDYPEDYQKEIPSEITLNYKNA